MVGLDHLYGTVKDQDLEKLQLTVSSGFENKNVLYYYKNIKKNLGISKVSILFFNFSSPVLMAVVCLFFRWCGRPPTEWAVQCKPATTCLCGELYGEKPPSLSVTTHLSM